jgi:membrane-associated phospholipid phosphatase
MAAEIGFIPLLQGQSWALPLMKFASFLGSLEFYLIILPAIYWCWDARLGFRIGLILTFSQGVNSALKIAFHSPRPYWINREIMPLEINSSFGMPSGHAQNAVCICGVLAWAIRRPWAWVLAIGLCLFIGVSRVYLGVHFPRDIIVGYAVGLLILVVFLGVESLASNRLRSLNFRQMVVVSFLASMGIIALYALGRMALGDWMVPNSWTTIAFATSGIPIAPMNPLEPLEIAGLLFGIAAGYSLLLEKGGYKKDVSASKCLICYITGIACLMCIWYGLRMIHPGWPAEYIMAYVRSMLAGAWITAGAPLLFIRLKLAKDGGHHDQK